MELEKELPQIGSMKFMRLVINATNEFINGNRQGVVDQVLSMDKVTAIAFTASMSQRFSEKKLTMHIFEFVTLVERTAPILEEFAQ